MTFAIDLRATYTTPLGPGQWETFVEFTNLTVHDNPCCSTCAVGVDGDGSTVLNRDLDYWPRVVPNLGIRWRY